MNTSRHFDLSICITTFNRANLIGATLESIVTQITDNCEIVVLDGASTDNTEEVVRAYAEAYKNVRYVRESSNSGVDRGYDLAVEHAYGDYCWLMSDDDIIKKGGLATMMMAIRGDFCLIVANLEIVDITMSKVLKKKCIDIDSDRIYRSTDADALFTALGLLVAVCSCIVIKRSMWRERERELYFGSLLIISWVILQRALPGNTLVIADPIVSYRANNTHTFFARGFETLMVTWPSVVWSSHLSKSAKEQICKAEPWRNVLQLLTHRAMGGYSLTEYRRFLKPRLQGDRSKWVFWLVGASPGVLVNTIFVLYYTLIKRDPVTLLPELRMSRFYLPNFGAFRLGRLGDAQNTR